MDINSIKNRLRDFIKHLFPKVKDALKLPYARLYIALSIVLTLLFIILTFPYDLIIKNQLQRYESSIGRSLYIGETHFGLIRDIEIDNIVLVFFNGGELNLRDVTVDVSFLSMFFSNNIKGELNVNNLKYESPPLSIENNLKSNFQVKWSTETGMPSDGFLDLTLQNVSVKGVQIKNFDIPPVRFTAIKADAKVVRNQLLIKEITFSGTDLRGNIRGTITMEKYFRNSRIDLRVEIDSTSKLLENYKILLGNVPADSDKKVKMTMTGTIANPDTPKIDFPQKPPEE